jgi:hypothetical protein
MQACIQASKFLFKEMVEVAKVQGVQVEKFWFLDNTTIIENTMKF